MPSRSISSPRVAVLADSDTRWKWGALTARRISPGARLHGYLLWGRATPTVRQLEEVGVAGVDSLSEMTALDFLDEMKTRTGGDESGREPYDMLILSCVGGTIQAMLHGLSRAWDRPAGRRPVVVTGYVGVVYEKLSDGLLLRHGADVVLANSRYDAERFRAVYDGVGAPSGSVVECALPFLGGAPYDAQAVDRGDRPFRVVFAVQPSVPEGHGPRRYLLRRALEHATRHPEREVVIKLRSKPGEHTTHIEDVPYQRLARETGLTPPANFRLEYGNMGEVLNGTDLLVTVSSTAALESLNRGIPTALLTDLGIREPLGNHYFIGSGCFASWDQLDNGHLPQADADWLAAQGVAADGDDDRPWSAARERVAGLLDLERLPPIEPYYTHSTAPGYLPGVLARHHLDPKGDPLPGHAASARAGRLRTATRSVMGRVARSAYRNGVQRVAPVIRRWGQL